VHQTQPEKQTTKTNTIQTTHMKIKTSILTLLAAALSVGSSWGQLPISPTSGIIRISLTAGQTNAVSVPFAKSIPFEGTISAVSGTTLTLAGVTLTPGALTNHAIYIPTHNEPANASATTGAYGRVVTIASNTATQVVTTTAITPFVGDDFQIIEQFTLGSLIGQSATSNYQLSAGSNPNNSDVVYVEANGVFTGYWHKAANPNQGWMLLSDTTGAGAIQTNVPVPFGKGLLIQRRTGNRTLTVAGEAITGRFRPFTTLGQTNVVNFPYTVAVPLIESGIGASINSGSNTNNSDIIYLETAGTFNGYWRRASNGNFYPLSDTTGTGTPVSSSVMINPGKALLMVERTAANIIIPQPFSE
jgi:hypothetical protein